MLHILNESNDPCFNLALEEYFLKQDVLTQDLVILWRNSPTVVIGRHQNLAAEINAPFIAANSVQVVRRLSGGGAVYHDPGNLNFTFITTATTIKRDEFARLTLPIIDALASFDVKAEFTGRNDLTLNGAKFSGNAQYLHRGRLLHHGTLLFDTDMKKLADALSGPNSKHTRRAVKSVKSTVTTLRPHLPAGTTLSDFSASLLKTIFARAAKPYRCYEPTPAEIGAIERIADDRYRTAAWTYGSLPLHNHCRRQTFGGGTVEVMLELKADAIINCKICGDFFASSDICALEALLKDTPWKRPNVAALLLPWLEAHPIDNISPQEVLDCFF